MPRDKSLTVMFLEEVGEVVEALNYEHKNIFSPQITIISSIILASAASFSRTIFSPLIILAVSIILTLLLKVDVRHWVKPVLFALFISSLVSIPLPVIVQGKPIGTIGPLTVTYEGLYQALQLVLRTIAASSIFTVLVLHLGLRGLMKGLRNLGIPERLVMLVELFVKYIPIFLRDVCNMIVAREARMIVRGGIKRTWRSLSTIVGELMLRASQRAWRLEMALRARNIGVGEKAVRVKVFSGTWKDIGLMALTAILLTASLIM